MPSNAFSNFVKPLSGSSGVMTTSSPACGSWPLTSFWYSSSSGLNSSPLWRTTPDCLNNQRAARLYFFVPSKSRLLVHHFISLWKARHVCGDPSQTGTRDQAPPDWSLSASPMTWIWLPFGRWNTKSAKRLNSVSNRPQTKALASCRWWRQGPHPRSLRTLPGHRVDCRPNSLEPSWSPTCKEIGVSAAAAKAQRAPRSQSTAPVPLKFPSCNSSLSSFSGAGVAA